MAEDTTKNNKTDTITRQALGRIARLGDLYDARTDTFCGTKMFNQQLPPDSPAVSKTDNHSIDTSITIVTSFHEKLKKLDVKGDLKLSVLSGMLELGGCGKYLNQEKNSFKSVEGTLTCKTTTMHESLELFNTDLKPHISIDALRHPTATHVVVQIYWGASCAITVTDKNSENNKKQDVEGNLMLHLKAMKSFISPTGEISGERNEEENSSWNKFSLEIFGDVLPDNSDEFPHTLEGALSIMKTFRQQIQNCNDGKGKPLKYVMFPLSSPDFQNYIGLKDSKIQPVRNLAEGRIVQVIQLFDHITELRQQVYDQVAEMKNNSHCVTSHELEEAHSLENNLEVQQADVRSDLARLLREVRSVKSDDQCLEAFCKEHCTTANEKFHKCQNIYKTVKLRIEFAKRCETFGAEYLQHPHKQRTASACDKYENVYVLFDGQADDETTTKNQSAFVELAKNSQLDSKTACYFTWTDCTGDVKIQHYRKNIRVHGDVAKELETKDMAVCIPAPRRTKYRLMTFEARCPGSSNGDCSKGERSWTCRNCRELLQFCPRNSELYCSCGHAKVDRFQFRCCSEAHGFTHLGDKELHELVALLTSGSGNYFCWPQSTLH